MFPGSQLSQVFLILSMHYLSLPNQVHYNPLSASPFLPHVPLHLPLYTSFPSLQSNRCRTKSMWCFSSFLPSVSLPFISSLTVPFSYSLPYPFYSFYTYFVIRILTFRPPFFYSPYPLLVSIFLPFPKHHLSPTTFPFLP